MTTGPHPPAARGRRSLCVAAAFCLFLALISFLLNGYWLPQAEAAQRATEYMHQSHTDLTYPSVKVWKRWNGHWAVAFESSPPVLVDVNRNGDCEEK